MVISDSALKVKSKTVLFWNFSFLLSPLLAKSYKAVIFLAPEDERCAQNYFSPSQIGCTSAGITVCIVDLSISQYIFFLIFLNYMRCMIQTSKAHQEPKPATVLKVKKDNSKGLVSMMLITQIVKLCTR